MTRPDDPETERFLAPVIPGNNTYARGGPINQPHYGQARTLSAPSPVSDPVRRTPVVHQVAAWIGIVRDVLLILSMLGALFVGGRILTAVANLGDSLTPTTSHTCPVTESDPLGTNC